MDYIEIAPIDKEAELVSIAGPESKLAKKHGLFIHRTGVAHYPYEFESRMQHLDLGLPRFEMFVLGPYDLVLSKLCSDRPKDEEDAKYLIGKTALNWETFLNIWESELKSLVPPCHETSVRLAREYFAF